MFGRSDDEKVAKYLAWFAEQVADPANWDMLRNDKDCANYMHPEQTPIPYDRGEILFRHGNPKIMQRMLSKNRQKQRDFVKDMSQYVGGNPANGLINPEYVKNEEIRQKTNEDLKKSYSVYTELSTKQIKDVQEEQRASYEPQGKWVEMSMWEAFQHWLDGGKVEEKPKDERGLSIAELTKGKK